MKTSWRQSIGVAQGMSGTPAALQVSDELLFGWRSGHHTYLARCPLLELRDAIAWIKRRIRDFSKYGGRESAEHKILRKAIAAQGSEFGMKLKRELGKLDHGVMEFETMFSPKSHSAGFTRQDLKEALEPDAEVIRVRIRRSGKLAFEPPNPGLPTNDGKVLK